MALVPGLRGNARLVNHDAVTWHLGGCSDGSGLFGFLLQAPTETFSVQFAGHSTDLSPSLIDPLTGLAPQLLADPNVLAGAVSAPDSADSTLYDEWLGSVNAGDGNKMSYTNYVRISRKSAGLWALEAFMLLRLPDGSRQYAQYFVSYRLDFDTLAIGQTVELPNRIGPDVMGPQLLIGPLGSATVTRTA